MANFKKVKLPEKIAALIEKRLTDLANADGVLPSVKKIGLEFEVSQLTALRAMRILRDRRVLSFKQGGTIRLKGKGQERKNTALATKPPTIRHAKLIEWFTQQIQAGVYRVGVEIPKSEVICRLHHVSKTTVSRAMQTLSDRKLIYKRGQNYIVGNKPQNAKNPTKVGAILIILPFEDKWRLAFESFRTRLFCQNIERQAEESRIDLHFALAESGREPFVAGLIPSGLSQIKAYVKDLGTKHLGTLMFDFVSQNKGQWIQYLSDLKRPAVLFDVKETFHAISSTNKKIFRAKFDNKVVNKHLVNNIFRLKHFNIAIPCLLYNPDSLRLAEELRATFRELHPEFNIHIEKEVDSFWDREESTTHIIKRLMNKGIPKIKSKLAEFLNPRPGYLNRFPETNTFQKKPTPYPLPLVLHDLLWITPIMASLFTKAPNTSLILAPGALEARACYYWLLANGVKIPEEISIVSLFKREELNPAPITTMGTSSELLAYLVFHALKADIPVKTNRFNEILVNSELIHHRTLGQARKGKIKLNLKGQWR